MLKKNIVLTLALMVLALAGCTTDEKTAPAAATPLPPTDIVYAQGFYDLERDATMTWRWMEPEGVVRLKNTGKDMVLKLSGRAPVERFKQPPVIKLVLNGVELDQMTGTPEILNREFTITAAQQGKADWSELKISSDKSFVPKDVDPGGTDPRRLAFSLTKLSWEAR